MTPVIGQFYNWKHQQYLLVYVGCPLTGGSRGWHQFRKVGDPRPVWCEVLPSDLPLLEPYVFTYPKGQKFSSRFPDQPVCRKCGSGYGSKVDGLCTGCRGRHYWENYREQS